MKVVAFNGSPRPEGNTAALIRMVFAELEREGITTEFVQLGGQVVRGCTACYQCSQRRDKRCVLGDDIINDCIAKIDAADGVLLGSPTYFANMSTEMKALIDRAGLVAKVNGDLFQRKVGAAVVAVRRAGSVHTFDSINHFFTINQMIIPGSIYWNLGVGREKGQVSEDHEGCRTMATLGRNMAWLLKKLA